MRLVDRRPILIVEDSDEDFEALMWALEKSDVNIPTVRCKDGEQAIKYLEERGTHAGREATRLPAIVLLDLNLPRTNGHQVLKHIKTSEHLRSLPVIGFTSSANAGDVQTCYQNGGNNYLVKPVGMAKLSELVRDVAEYWFRLSLLPEPTVNHDEQF
jgi:CheY-like chemotaxis protein